MKLKVPLKIDYRVQVFHWKKSGGHKEFGSQEMKGSVEGGERGGATEEIVQRGLKEREQRSIVGSTPSRPSWETGGWGVGG